MVIARLIDPSENFCITENSRLGGIEITKNFTIPRAIDKEENPRLDIFAFEIKHKKDADKLQEKKIVELVPGNNLELLEPWEPVNGLATGLEKELTKELHEDHILFRKAVVAIAKRGDRDDVLFHLPEDDKYAVVHLTWKGKREVSVEYPAVEFYHHWSELYEQRILPDHKDWID